MKHPLDCDRGDTATSEAVILSDSKALLHKNYGRLVSNSYKIAANRALLIGAKLGVY